MPFTEEKQPGQPPAIPTTGTGQVTSHPEIACTQCGTMDTPAIEHGHWGPHRMRAMCHHCHAFVKWVSSRTQAEREAARQRGINGWMAKQAPTEKQLDCLKALGHDSAPANRLEASKTIDALLVKGGANE